MHVNIVLVEDNPADVLLVKDVLEQEGLDFSIEHHANGEEAAKALASLSSTPDLILLDINIPRIDGIELLRMIREQPVTAHVVTAVLTSSQAPSDRQRAERFGADAYIIKPSSYYEFRDQVGGAIRQLLDRSKPRAQGLALIACAYVAAAVRCARIAGGARRNTGKF